MNIVYRHFYLYAKGWYHCTDRIADLRKIASVFSDTNLNQVTVGHVVNILEDIILELFKDDPTALRLFFRTLIEKSITYEPLINSIGVPCNYTWKESTASTAIIDACIALMYNATSNKFPDGLGEPDSRILPLREEFIG